MLYKDFCEKMGMPVKDEGKPDKPITAEQPKEEQPRKGRPSKVETETDD